MCKATAELVETLKQIESLLDGWPTMRALSAYGAEEATSRKLKARELITAALAKVEG